MVLKETLLTARAVAPGSLTIEQAETCPDAVAVLGEALRGCRGEIEAEYPLVFRPGAPGRLVVARDERQQPVAGCAYLARDWRLPSGPFRAGLIGSVATHPDHRRQGWAARVLARAEAELARDGCAFALLWADDPGFYERLGYRGIGTEVDYLVEPRPRCEPPRGTIRAYEPSDLAALAALHAEHPVRIERSLDEMRQLLAIPGVQTCVLEREGSARAYACMGKGGDLRGVIHEWAGSPSDVADLAEELSDQHGGAAVFLAPSGAEAHHRIFQGERGWLHQTGILGLAKPLGSDHWPATWGLPQDLALRFPAGDAGLIQTSPFAWGLDSV